MPKTIYSKEQKKEVIKLRKEGLTYQKIADMLEIKNLTTVSDICEEAGLPKRNVSKHNYSIGQRFHNFIIVNVAADKISDETGDKYRRWQCQCDCGRLFLITTKQIHRGQKSCGCLSILSKFHEREPKYVIGGARLNQYVNGARKRNLVWELSKEQFFNLLFANCYYCGTEPLTLVKKNKHQYMVNGIDRMNNNVGYTNDNSVSCCIFCNRAKNNSTLEEFMLWIKNIRLRK